MTRRFEIGPFVLAFGALLLLVGLFLDWYGAFNAWAVFEFVDLFLAALAVASVIGAVGLITPEVEYVDKRVVPWLVGIAFVVVAAQLMDPPPVASRQDLELGAWLSLAGTVLMVGGAILVVHQGVLRRRGRGPGPPDPRRRRGPPAAADRDRPAARRPLEHLAPAPAARRSRHTPRGPRAELMPDAGDVSFELERFEWTADDRLVVVGRWNGVSGRRLLRPALHVDAGGRRTRVTGSAEDQDPWRATFDWDAARGDVVGAELELGRSLVVELPPPRRRRRRSAQVTAENDLRVALAELKAERDSLRLELDEQPDVDVELAAARAELQSLRDARPDAALLAAARAEVERLTRELEALRADADGSRADAERLASKVESLRADAAALVETRAELEPRAGAGRRALAAPDESAELAALRAEVAQARSEIELLTADAEALAAAQAELEAARAEAERLAAELAAVRSEAPAELEALRTQADVARAEADELAGLRLAHGSLKAAHEQLEDELDGLRAMREERDALAAQVQQLLAQTGDEENQRAALGDLIRGLQEQTTAAEDSNSGSRTSSPWRARTSRACRGCWPRARRR